MAKVVTPKNFVSNTPKVVKPTNNFQVSKEYLERKTSQLENTRINTAPGVSVTTGQKVAALTNKQQKKILQNNLDSIVSEAVKPTISGFKQQQKTIESKATIPSVDYDAEYAKELQLKKEADEAEKAWEEWKKSDYPILPKALDYLGNPYITELKNNYESKEKAYLEQKSKNTETNIQKQFGVTGLEYIEQLKEKKKNARNDTEKEIYKKQLDTIRKDLYGKSNVFKYIGSAANRGLTGAGKGVAATFDFLLGTPAKMLGFENNFFSQVNADWEKYYENADANVAKNALATGDDKQILGQITTGTIQALPDMALMILSGTSSTVAKLGTDIANPSTINMIGNAIKETFTSPIFYSSFIREAGINYEEALESGKANELEASLAALFGATINARIEMGGWQQLPNSTKGIKGFWKKAWNWIKTGGFEEGFEEVKQRVASGITNKVFYDSDKKIFSVENPDAIINPNEMIKEFGMGTIVGMILGGGTITINKIINSQSESELKTIGRVVKKSHNIQELIDYSKSSKNDLVRSIARSSNPNNITDVDIGVLYQKAALDAKEMFDDVYTEQELNTVANEGFSENTPKIIKDIRSAAFANKLIEMNIEPESNELYNNVQNIARNQQLQIEEQSQETIGPEGQVEEVAKEIGFREPTDQQIYREPTAEENEEALFGERKNAKQRHILDVAKKKAAQKLGLQVFEAGASGALMGMGFGAIGSAAGYKNYKNSPEYQKVKSNSEILNLIQKVKNGDFKANDKVYLEKATPEVAESIKNITGIDVSDFKVAIEARQIEHILKDHGINGKTDHSMSDDIDISKMEYILSKPDDIRKAGKTQAYTYMKNGKNKGADTVLYEKVLDENSYYVVQAVPDTKAKTLYIVSAFIGKSGYKKEASQLTDVNNPSATPISGSVIASNTTVPQNTQGVNNIISNPEQNNTQANPNGPANFMPEGESGEAESGEIGRVDGEIATFGGVDTANRKHLDKVQQDEVTAIGEKLGRTVIYEDFYNLDKFKGKKKIPDGYIDNDGNVHINYYAKRPVYFLFKHEITHYLKRSLALYNDFMNLVIDSNAFKDWLNKKGYSSIDTLKTEIMDTYNEVKGFDESKCYDEILANFVGEYLFGGENAINQNLIDTLEPKQKKTFMDVIKGIIDYLKSKFQKNKPIQTEIKKIENEFIKVYKEAVEVKADEAKGIEERYAIYNHRGNLVEVDWDSDNFSSLSQQLKNHLEEVNNMKPVDSISFKSTTGKNLYAQVFEAFKKFGFKVDVQNFGIINIDEDEIDLAVKSYINTDAEAAALLSIPRVLKRGKIISGHQNHKNRNYPTITFAAPVELNGKVGNVVVAVKVTGKTRYNAHRVLMPDGTEFVLDKEKDTEPQSARVTNENEGQRSAKDSVSNNKLTQPELIVKNNISEESENYSIPSTTSAESLLERYENGEITRQEYLDTLKGKKTLNPVEIANLKEEDANTAPPLQRKKGEAKGDKQSKFYGSIQGSELFGEEFKQEAASDEFIEKYKSITNKETLQTAAKELEEGGKEYIEKWWAIKPERANLIDTTVGFILMDRYQRTGKIEQAIAVAEKVREFGTASGQQIQIFSIIGRFDPDMMVAYAKKELSEAFETMIKGKTNKWIDKNKEKFQLTEEDIEFIRRRTLQAAMFEDGTRQKAVALAEIQKTIQDKIPPESGDSIRALQRISMLLNPKTNERNIIGNAGMVGVFVASDVFGSGIDKIISQKTGVRTTGNFDVKSVSEIKKGLYESYDDFKRGIRTKQEELNRFDVNASRSSKNFNENGGGIFGTKVLKKQLNDVAKVLNKIDNFTSFCLEAGDRPFFEMWYMNSLNTQFKLNNLEIPTPEMLEIAKEEALKRTWQDDNVYTRAVSNLKKNVNIIHIPGTSYGLGDFIFKFVKTPTNLAKAIVEFSPLGFAGATSNAIKLKNAIETNQFNAQLQKEFVRSTSNAITGSLVYALVAIGAALGVVKLSGDGDEDKDVSNYEKYIMGIPPYSIEFLGANMTYDWMQPFGSVLATVADFMQTKKEEPDLKTSAVIWEAIKAGGKTFTKQSFLQSMYDFFSQDDIVEGISSLVLSEPAAFIPQAFSQLASYLDKYRRTTYDATNAFQTSINKMIAKIPGLRTKLPKQVNVLGEDVKNTQYLNPWEAFASPWNTYPKSSNEIVGEIYDLYKKTGEDSVMPRAVPNYLTVKGNKITFSSEEKAQFQRDIGQSSAEMLAILFDNSEYKKLSDNEKADVVSKIYEFAYAKSKSAIKYDYETLSAMAGEKKNGDPVLSKSDYKKLPEKARQIIAQEYFLSKAEVRYMDNYKSLIQSFIKKVKE